MTPKSVRHPIKRASANPAAPPARVPSANSPSLINRDGIDLLKKLSLAASAIKMAPHLVTALVLCALLPGVLSASSSDFVYGSDFVLDGGEIIGPVALTNCIMPPPVSEDKAAGGIGELQNANNQTLLNTIPDPTYNATLMPEDTDPWIDLRGGAIYTPPGSAGKCFNRSVLYYPPSCVASEEQLLTGVHPAVQLRLVSFRPSAARLALSRHRCASSSPRRLAAAGSWSAPASAWVVTPTRTPSRPRNPSRRLATWGSPCPTSAASRRSGLQAMPPRP